MGIDGDQRHTGDNCKTGQKSSRASHRQQPRPSLPRLNDSREKSLPCQPGLRFIPLLIFVGCGKATVRTPLPRGGGCPIRAESDQCQFAVDDKQNPVKFVTAPQNQTTC
jgi:hypothetical protein